MLAAQDDQALIKLPKRMRSNAKSVRLASTREQAHKDSGAFVATCGPNFPKPKGCLENDRQKLLTFYNVTVEHWVYIRTTKPSKLAFATVRVTTAKTWRHIPENAISALVYKLKKREERLAQTKGIQMVG